MEFWNLKKPSNNRRQLFTGARSEVAEGVIVGEGSALSMGVFIGASTKYMTETLRNSLWQSPLIL